MSKYVIEIEEKPLCVFDKDTQTFFPRLWRVKGFNSLVLDEEGLSRLEVLNSDYINEHFGDLQDTVYQRGFEDGKKEAESSEAIERAKADAFNKGMLFKEEKIHDAYKRGLDDAWECAKKLFSTMSETEIEKVFPTEWENGFYGLMQMKPQYAIAKLKAYEEKQKADDEIKVGDEVVWTEDENVVIVVTSVYTADDMEWCDGVCKDGKVYSILMKNARKTGRRFDIQKILEEMRND